MTKRPPIRKAVFPVAGLGTRFLPATKANPKEMLPIVDKPLIQFAAEEAVEAGITELVFVTGRNKRAIPDHFDKAHELETRLEAGNKTLMLELVRDILPESVTCIYIRQYEALGLGHAVGCARSVIGNEPFAVLLADDLMDAQPGVVSQMVQTYQEHGGSIIAAEEVPHEHVQRYGIMETTDSNGDVRRVTSIVEKPLPENTASNLAVVGRYILTPRIFEILENLAPGAGGEIQLTDAIQKLMQEEPVWAYRYHGLRYDCGSKLGYLQATVSLGLKHHEVGKRFREYLAGMDF
jgi:UTP--glucose-1-phosphate uridylyltransferase